VTRGKSHKAPGNGNDWDNAAEDIGTMGMPEDRHCANILRAVERYLSGRPAA
jgi:hypothetical protein